MHILKIFIFYCSVYNAYYLKHRYLLLYIYIILYEPLDLIKCDPAGDTIRNKL